MNKEQKESETVLKKLKTSIPDEWIKFVSFLENHLHWWMIGVALIMGLLARYALVPICSGDVGNYLMYWMKLMSNPNSTIPSYWNFQSDVPAYGFNFLVSDYFFYDQTPFYMFTLAVIAQTDYGSIVSKYGDGRMYASNWMISLKSIGFVFDICMAFGIYCIIKEITKNKNYAAAGFATSFFLPIQIVNSAMWGQNDSWFSCMAIWSFAFLMKYNSDKPKISDIVFSMIFAGWSLAIKAQGIFIMPFYFFLMLYKKIKFRYILIIPLALLATYVPYYFMGASFTKPFVWIFNGFSSYSDLSYHGGNFWEFFSFVTNSDTNELTSRIIAIGSYFFFIGALATYLFALLAKKPAITKESLILIATSFAMFTPFFMSKMHERYFYLADVMIFVYAFTNRKRYWLIPIKQASSLFTYSIYMFGRNVIQFGDNTGIATTTNMIIGATLNVLVLTQLLYDVFKLPTETKKEESPNLDVKA